MSREWKPGDVAMIRTEARTDEDCVAVRTDRYEWNCAHGRNIPDVMVSARPLVVIDPVEITGPDETDGADPIEEIARCLLALAERDGADEKNGSYRGRVAARLSAEFRSLLAPPKPERPAGWGAVVEDNTGAYWTQYAPEADVWINYAEGKRQYADITVVRVVSEGVL